VRAGTSALERMHFPLRTLLAARAVPAAPYGNSSLCAHHPDLV